MFSIALFIGDGFAQRRKDILAQLDDMEARAALCAEAMIPGGRSTIPFRKPGGRRRDEFLIQMGPQ